MKKESIESLPCITTGKFLKTCCGCEKEFEELTHEQLKKICKVLCATKLQAVPFEYVDFEKVAIGELILVKDCFGNIVPYNNPFLTYEKDIQKKQYRR